MDPVWKLNKLWTIEYRDDDVIGYILSHISMISVIAPFACFSVFIANRSVRSFRLFSGLVFCTLFARILKKLVNSPRPESGHFVMPGNSGFPSDHSMSG